MGVHAHAKFTSDIALSSPLPFPSHFISAIFSGGGGGDMASIISNSTGPPPFRINHSISPLCVLFFLVHVCGTVSVGFYCVVCSDYSP